MGGREVSRPYRVWFFAEGEQCFPLNRDYAALKKSTLLNPEIEI